MVKGNFFAVVFLMLAACAAETRVSLVKEDRVDKSQTVLIASIKWKENYLNLESKERVTILSNELDASEDLLRFKSKVFGENELLSPLYYISNQRVMFHGKDGDIQIVKYDKSLRDYRHLGVYAFPPDEYILRKFFQNEETLYVDADRQISERWHLSKKEYGIPTRRIDLKKGKIYYLGSLELFFETQKELFGFFPKEMVNRRIKLTRVKWTDEWDSVKKELKKNHPWLPTENVINLSHTGDHVYVDYDWVPYQEQTNTEEKRGEHLFW